MAGGRVKGNGVELGPSPRSVMRGLAENEGQVGSEESKLETFSFPAVWAEYVSQGETCIHLAALLLSTEPISVWSHSEECFPSCGIFARPRMNL